MKIVCRFLLSFTMKPQKTAKIARFTKRFC
jgi:hypothetical protein